MEVNSIETQTQPQPDDKLQQLANLDQAFDRASKLVLQWLLSDICEEFPEARESLMKKILVPEERVPPEPPTYTRGYSALSTPAPSTPPPESPPLLPYEDSDPDEEDAESLEDLEDMEEEEEEDYEEDYDDGGRGGYAGHDSYGDFGCGFGGFLRARNALPPSERDEDSAGSDLAEYEEDEEESVDEGPVDARRWENPVANGPVSDVRPRTPIHVLLSRGRTPRWPQTQTSTRQAARNASYQSCQALSAWLRESPNSSRRPIGTRPRRIGNQAQR